MWISCIRIARGKGMVEEVKTPNLMHWEGCGVVLIPWVKVEEEW